MPGFAGLGFGSSPPSVFEFDLVAYLSAGLGMQVYAPLKRGQKYRGPVNVAGAGPIVSVARVTDDRDLILTGPSGIVQADFQVDVFAQINDDALVLGDSIRWGLQNFAGTMGSTEVQAVSLLNQMNGWLENEDPSKVGVYRLINEFRIWYVEPVRPSNP